MGGDFREAHFSSRLDYYSLCIFTFSYIFLRLAGSATKNEMKLRQ